MKLLTCLFACLIFVSINASEGAATLYELNKETFSYKEIINNKSICDYQNELAKKANKEAYKCAYRASGSNTKQGDEYLRKVNRNIKNLENKVSRDSQQALDWKHQAIEAYIKTLQ